MTRRIGNVLLLEREAKQQCDLCGKIAELRPYGPNGEAICHACGMKNLAATEAAFLARLNGDTSEKSHV